MSAARVQSNSNIKSSPMTPTNSTRAIYFDCGEIVTSNNATENSNNNNSTNDHNNITASLTDLNMININCSNDSSMNRMDQIIQQTQGQGRMLNNQYRPNFHAALNRTASTPQPQRYHNQFHNHQQQFHMQQQPRPSQKQPREQQEQQELPQTSQQYSNVGTLVNTIAASLGNINIHRKLERTQSEPMPPQEATKIRYKTELCRPFDERGDCKYGEKCQFAHGQEELRSLQRHPKYKTEICRTYHSSGFCPYGSRCHFLHNFEDQTRHQEQQPQFRRQNTLQQQNHSNFYALGAASSLNNVGYAAMGGSVGAINHPLPMTPPSSMSTGSDRESPLSISPTSSMTNFSFGDQISPAISFQNAFQSTFTYANTPPESPNALMSPISTPPPSLMLAQTSLYIESVVSNSIGVMNAARSQKPAVGQALQKSFSSPIAVERSGHINNNTSASVFATNTYNLQLEVNHTSLLNAAASLEETRLPVFNRISKNSNAEIFSHVA